jgi:hypothetical protein
LKRHLARWLVLACRTKDLSDAQELGFAASVGCEAPPGGTSCKEGVAASLSEPNRVVDNAACGLLRGHPLPGSGADVNPHDVCIEPDLKAAASTHSPWQAVLDYTEGSVDGFIVLLRAHGTVAERDLE